MNVLAVVNLRRYASFHRRPHYEAIRAVIPGFELMCVTQLGDPRLRRNSSAPIPMNIVPKLFPGITKKAVPFASRVDRFLVATQVRRLLTRFDVLHVSSPYDAEIIRHRTTQLLVYELYDPRSLMGAPAELERAIIRESDVVLATARALISDYIPRFDPPDSLRAVYWPNAVDLAHWKHRIIANDRPPTVGYLGNINAVTFDAGLFEVITTAFPEVRFEIAGSVNFTDPTGADARRVRAALRAHNVAALGFVPYGEVPEVVRRWDVGLLLDPMNALSRFVHHNKIYQYLAVGLPVVATRAQPDYEDLGFPVYLASDASQFIRDLTEALRLSRHEGTVAAAISVAGRNSCADRARAYAETLQAEL